MRLLTLIVAMACTLGGLAWLRADRPADEQAEGGLTLLGTLAEWQYPGIKMPHGATMSDGGNPATPSTKLQTVMTTPDSFEQVLKFYSKKFGVEQDGDKTVIKPDAADPKSVTTQDDSQNRPMKLHVFTINKQETSTTLVVSRADGEKETHIVWTHYVPFDTQ